MALTGRWNMTPQERYDAQTDKSGDCWLWAGTLSAGRYASFMVNGRPVKVHRWIYEQEVGPIPEGHQIDHTCGTTSCVRPSHLRAVTAAENVRAHWREQRGICRNGHPMVEGNITITTKGSRCCLTCRRERKRRYLRK